MQDHRTQRRPDPTPPARQADRCATRALVHSERHSAFGHVVRFTRARRGLSQEELGFRARLHRNYVGAIERGEINPTFRVLLKLATGLSTPLSQLIASAEEEERNPSPMARSGFVAIAMPERFVLEAEQDDGTLVDHGLYRADDFTRTHDGAYVNAGHGGSPIWLRCIRQSGAWIVCLDGSGARIRYRLRAVGSRTPR
jgi:transcriptional regulator with XRE-family HTH domain